jgi:HK97 gp10 family phage protein
MAEFEFAGFESMLAKFDAAKQEVKYKSGRSALRKVANMIAGKVREGALKLDDPETAESIAKNVAVRWGSKRFKATGDLAFRVGILGGAGGNKKSSELASLPGKDSRHWRYLEFGSENNPATPFMRPAAQNNANEAFSIFATTLEKSLNAAIRKANKATK